MVVPQIKCLLVHKPHWYISDIFTSHIYIHIYPTTNRPYLSRNWMKGKSTGQIVPPIHWIHWSYHKSPTNHHVSCLNQVKSTIFAGWSHPFSTWNHDFAMVLTWVFLCFSHGAPGPWGALGPPGLNWHAYEFENDGPLLRGINDVGPCTFDSEPRGEMVVIFYEPEWMRVDDNYGW